MRIRLIQFGRHDYLGGWWCEVLRIETETWAYILADISWSDLFGWHISGNLHVR